MTLNSPEKISLSAYTILLWKKDPKSFTSQAEFMKSPDILYHGSQYINEYSQQWLYANDNGNSSTAGKWFYCTDEFEVAKSFAIWEKSKTIALLPYNARMLVCSDDQLGYLPLPRDMVLNYIQLWLSLEIPNNISWNYYNKHILHKGFLNRLFGYMKIHEEFSPTLRVLLQTDGRPLPIDGDWERTDTNTGNWPPILDIWEDTLKQFWYDGLILEEWVDNMYGKFALSYVFVNYAVIWTFDNWKNQQKIRDSIAMIAP
jgi:hypothetical protein